MIDKARTGLRGCSVLGVRAGLAILLRFPPLEVVIWVRIHPATTQRHTVRTGDRYKDRENELINNSSNDVDTRYACRYRQAKLMRRESDDIYKLR